MNNESKMTLEALVLSIMIVTYQFDAQNSQLALFRLPAPVPSTNASSGASPSAKTSLR
jgi:hypothetical protein